MENFSKRGNMNVRIGIEEEITQNPAVKEDEGILVN